MAGASEVARAEGILCLSLGSETGILELQGTSIILGGISTNGLSPPPLQKQAIFEEGGFVTR